VPVLVVALTVETPGGSAIAAIVIPASSLGKLKTITQVVAVLALIAANDPDAAWVQALVYLMVVTTVVSGADYFLNFSRKLEESSRTRAPVEPTG
jgi:phosphatidylglycerophosphate synthase